MKKFTKRLFGFMFTIMMLLYQFSPALLMVMKAEEEPNNDTVTIHFNGGSEGVVIDGQNVTYTVGETSVTVGVSATISNDVAVVSRSDINNVTFSLTNFDSESMLIRIAGTNDGFGADLAVNNNTATLSGLNTPDEIDLIVEEKPEGGNNGNSGNGENNQGQVVKMEPMFDGATLVDSTHITMSPEINDTVYNMAIAITAGEATFADGGNFVSTSIDRNSLNSVVFTLTGDYNPEEIQFYGFINSNGSEKQIIHVNNDGTFTLPGSLCDDTHIGFEAIPSNNNNNEPQNGDNMVVTFDRATFVDSTHINMSDGKNSFGVTLSGGGSFVSENNTVVVRDTKVNMVSYIIEFDNSLDNTKFNLMVNGETVGIPASRQFGFPTFDNNNGYHIELNEIVNGPQACTGDCVNATVNYTYKGEAADIIFNDSFAVNAETDFFEFTSSGGSITNKEFSYEAGANSNKITVNVAVLFIEYLTKLTINGVDYTNQLPKTIDELYNAFSMQRTNVLLEIDKASDDTYTIYTESVHADQTNTAVGNFLWTTNPDEQYQRECVMGDGDHCDEWHYFTDNEGNKIVNDDYVDHATLEIVNVRYNGKDFTSGTAGSGFDFNTAPGQNSAVLPVGSIATIRITPDYGYQLTEFTVNGGAFTATENIGEYTFTINPGNFHLGAHVTKVDDEVKANSNKISSGEISLNNTLTEGSAQLTVSDATVSSEKIKGFEKAAGEYTIQNVLDIDLYQVVYKGTEDSSKVWSTQIETLKNKATISIKLEEGVNAEDIIIVHNIHNGETFEVIPIDSYDPKTRTITFKADSFSDFAIATKGTSTNTPTTQTYKVVFDNDGLLSEVEVKDGEKVTEPGVKAKAGYVFVGWFEENATSKFDFSKPITRDVELLAVWEEAVEVKPATNSSSNDKAGASALSEVIEAGQKGEMSIEVMDELDPVVVGAIEDAIANNKDLSVNLTTDEITEDSISEEVLDKINDAVKEDEKILGYFEIDLNVLVDGQEVGKLTRLENPIKITVDAKDLIKDLPKEESGYTRTYVVIRLHNGETDIIPATLNADGTIDFVTDRFSTYTIAYTDIKNPKTGDSIIYFIVMLGVSILGLISTLIYKKCFVRIEK